MQLVENHEEEKKEVIHCSSQCLLLMEFDRIFSELSQLIQQNYLEKKNLTNSDFNP